MSPSEVRGRDVGGSAPVQSHAHLPLPVDPRDRSGRSIAWREGKGEAAPSDGHQGTRPLGTAHSPSLLLLTSLLDAGGWGGSHRLGRTAEPVGSGPRGWAWGQGSRGGASQLPHPLLALVLSPLPVHVLGVPGCTLQRQERRYWSAQRPRRTLPWPPGRI